MSSAHLCFTAATRILDHLPGHSSDHIYEWTLRPTVHILYSLVWPFRRALSLRSFPGVRVHPSGRSPIFLHNPTLVLGRPNYRECRLSNTHFLDFTLSMEGVALGIVIRSASGEQDYIPDAIATSVAMNVQCLRDPCRLESNGIKWDGW